MDLTSLDPCTHTHARTHTRTRTRTHTIISYDKGQEHPPLPLHQQYARRCFPVLGRFMDIESSAVTGSEAERAGSSTEPFSRREGTAPRGMDLCVCVCVVCGVWCVCDQNKAGVDMERRKSVLLFLTATHRGSSLSFSVCLTLSLCL